MTQPLEFDDLIVRTAERFAETTKGMTPEDAEDMAQEGRIACWQYDREAESLSYYPDNKRGPGLTVNIAKQACHNYERVTRAERELDDPLPPFYEGAATEGNAEFDAQLGDILGKIVNDETEAAVAMAVIYQGLTVREASEVLDMAKSTVQRTIDRLRERAEQLGITPAGGAE
jgi:DNA-directed RNA polymerase specialized sigma24 family protein